MPKPTPSNAISRKTSAAIVQTIAYTRQNGEDWPSIGTIVESACNAPGVPLDTIAAAFGYIRAFDDFGDEGVFHDCHFIPCEDTRVVVIHSAEALQLLREFQEMSGLPAPRCELKFSGSNGRGRVGRGRA